MTWQVPLLIWLGLCLTHPTRRTPLVFGAGLLAYLVLVLANEYKISLNGMPITAIDYYFVSKHPALLWRLLGAPGWLAWTLIGGVALILLALLFLLIARLRRLGPAFVLRAAPTMILSIVAATIYYGQIQGGFQDFLEASDESTQLWSGRGVAQVSRRFGPIAFLIYSAHLEERSGAVFLDESVGTSSASPDILAKTIARYLTIPRPARSPNIVLMQMESIFNPNWAFDLRRQIDSILFRPNRYTKLLAPMRVNTVGGGSWITEFEILTGLDTRLFGYSGFYSHAAVAPYLDGGLPAFLHGLGYDTNAYYPAMGSFYNVERAFERYGVGTFWDPRELALHDDWASSDSEIALASIRNLPSLHNRPFFSFIVTNGAHSPYDCSFTHASDFRVMFARRDDFDLNCTLNEYVLHLEDSERAVSLVLRKLVEIEESTGRPFVFAVYGDHQPHSFTRTWQRYELNFDDVRTTAPANQTFLHIMASTQTEISNVDAEISTTVVPTIMSAFVADQPNQTYLPQNLHLYSKCGSNSFPQARSVGMFGFTKAPNRSSRTPNPGPDDTLPVSDAECSRAQLQTIFALRRSGIVRLSD